VVAVLVFAADRISKAIVAGSVPLGVETPVIDHFLWITHVQNSGAAFGLAPFGSIFFLVVSIVVSIALVAYVAREGGTLFTNALLGLVLGGTVGNAYDRALHGSVTDFLTVHWWPVFNVADSAISIGVVLLVLTQVLRRPPASAD
jgi:signal peptidase II